MKSIMSRVAESTEVAVRKHLTGHHPGSTRPQSARTQDSHHDRSASRVMRVMRVMREAPSFMTLCRPVSPIEGLRCALLRQGAPTL
jgi:hypothetical protein